jgi:hypothetical protein
MCEPPKAVTLAPAAIAGKQSSSLRGDCLPFGYATRSLGLDTCTCMRCKCTAKEHAYSTILAATRYFVKAVQE